MRKLLAYLKPFSFMIALVVGLTFLQVQMELALPDYMSDIVTNGIEYGGIKNNIPLAVRESKMYEILAFVDDDAAILSNYTLVDKNQEYELDNQLVKFNENIYVLNETYDESINSLLTGPIIYATYAKEADVDFAMLNSSSEYKDEVMLKLGEKLAGFAENLNSVAIVLVKDEYTAIGLDTTVIQTNYILFKGLEMLGISLIGAFAQIASTYFATKTAAKFAKTLRRDVFKKVEAFSSAEFSKFSTSSLITRTTNDIQQVRMLVQMMMRIMLMAPMMGITSVFKVFRYPDMLWILLVAIIAMTVIMIGTLVIAMPKFKRIQTTIDKMNGVMREFLEGMLVIRAFNSEKHEEKRFDDANNDLAKTHLFVERAMSITMPMMTFIMNVVTVGIIWFGASLIDINVMTVGDMMAFIQYATHVLMSFMIVAMVWVMVPRSLVSANRIFEILETENSIEDIYEPLSLSDEAQTLSFENVSFKYPNAEEYVLKNISFEAKPEETVAFIGSTGSGKSTLVKLVPRLFDVTEGSIKLGGIDIRDVKQSDLRDRIGFVPQKAVLFTGSIKSNIEFGRDVSEDDLNQAIDVSQTRNIINEKEEGLDSPITQGGTNVSGGQKQRISIARALAKDASIYIFDDSFSALDYQTDKNLRAALNEMIKESKAIVLIVAQRISTIRDADKIVVLDDGEIVGIGKHDELMQSCEVYQQIARSQLSEEELAHA